MEKLQVNVAEEKVKIVSLIKQKGPIVSQSIAKTLNIQSFLTSALLSELVKDKVVKSSHLRVGGSPLYYFSGQEAGLDNYTNFLAMKEKEAFGELKKEEIIQDSKAEPAIRVAFRNIKDFAIPLRVTKGNEELLFWKFHLLSAEEASKKINDLLGGKEKKQKEEKKEKREEAKAEKKEKERAEKAEKSEKKKVKRPNITSLVPKVEDWANANKASLKEVSDEGKEVKAKVTIPSAIGDIDFLLFCKGKSLSEGDVIGAYQKGLAEKMPVLMLGAGKISKKAEKLILELGMAIRKL